MSEFAATGLSCGPTPDPLHARTAVNRALRRSGRHSASGVFLFLTSGYIDPGAAIIEASRAAGSLSVAGCHGDSLVSEDEQLVDTEGAIALVLHDPIAMSHRASPTGTSIDFCTPSSVASAWLDAPARRFGAVSSVTSTHQTPSVWSAGRICQNGHAEVHVHGCTASVGIAHGIEPLTPPVTVRKTDGFAVLQIGRHPALNVLSQAIPERYLYDSNAATTAETLMAGVVFGDPGTAIAKGRYRLNPVIGADRSTRSITFSDKLTPGEQVFLAISDRLAAQRDMTRLLPRLEHGSGRGRRKASPPAFALYLPCVSQRPDLDGAADPALEVIRQRYPGMPLIGFYGHGQINPLETGSHLHFHCTGVGLFGR